MKPRLYMWAGVWFVQTGHLVSVFKTFRRAAAHAALLVPQ